MHRTLRRLDQWYRRKREARLWRIERRGYTAGREYIAYEKSPHRNYVGWRGRVYHLILPREYKIYWTGFTAGKTTALQGVPTNRLLPPARQNPPMHIIRPVPQPTGTLLKSYLASHPRQQVAPTTPIPESEPDTSWLNSPTIRAIAVSPSLYVEEPVNKDDTAKQFTGILKLKYYASQTKKQEGA